MARGRMLNRKVGVDEKVQDLWEKYGPVAVICHHRLIAFLDRNGNTRIDLAAIKANVFPIANDITTEDLTSFVRGMCETGLFRAYKVDRILYGHFPRFRDNQVGLDYNKEKDECPLYTKELDVTDLLIEGTPFDQFARKLIEELPAKKKRSGTEGEVEEEVEGERTSEETVSDTACTEFVRRWNAEVCLAIPEMKVVRENLNPQRLAVLRRMLANPEFTIEAVTEALRNSPHCRGVPWDDGDSQWTCDFDWIIGMPKGKGGETRPENFEKLMEGKYASKSGRSSESESDVADFDSTGW